jgi:hypothetical protein
MPKGSDLIPIERIERHILLVRGHKVMLDRGPAAIYGIETRALNQAVKRNRDRFPPDFMMTLTREEIGRMSQSVICSGAARLKHSKNVNVFTDHGVAMLSSVLNSPRAIQPRLPNAEEEDPRKRIGFRASGKARERQVRGRAVLRCEI